MGKSNSPHNQLWGRPAAAFIHVGLMSARGQPEELFTYWQESWIAF
jgi:hypothetical protein